MNKTILKLILLSSLYFVVGCSIPIEFVGYFWDVENENVDINMLDKNTDFKLEKSFNSNKNCNRYLKDSINIVICSGINGSLIAFEKSSVLDLDDDIVVQKMSEFKKIINISDVANKQIEVKKYEFFYEYLKDKETKAPRK